MRHYLQALSRLAIILFHKMSDDVSFFATRGGGQAIPGGSIMSQSKVTKDRKRLITLFGRLYKRHMTDSPPCCFYCGDKFQVLDHCPPLHSLDYVGVAGMRRRKIPLALIPSCGRCNLLLGRRELLTAASRLEYLEKRYTSELERIKGLWTDSEVNELGDYLKRVVKGAYVNQQDLIRKIGNIQRRIIRTWTHPEFSIEQQEEMEQS